jgi:hypothetical protein
MTPDELDAKIIASSRREWRKVAFVIVTVAQDHGADYDTVAVRLAALVGAGKLESQGDITNWRFSEVRLPA